MTDPPIEWIEIIDLPSGETIYAGEPLLRASRLARSALIPCNPRLYQALCEPVSYKVLVYGPERRGVRAHGAKLSKKVLWGVDDAPACVTVSWDHEEVPPPDFESEHEAQEWLDAHASTGEPLAFADEVEAQEWLDCMFEAPEAPSDTLTVTWIHKFLDA